MKVLVANLGSTSFKYRLYVLSNDADALLARGQVERIGSGRSTIATESAHGRTETEAPVPDHGEAVRLCLQQLTDAETGVIADPSEVAAIGFKAVHAKQMSGVQRVDANVLQAMEAYNAVAPAHNPPYVQAMRMVWERFPNLPLVAAFETGFHQTIPDRNRRYAIPEAWATDLGIQRWGFHGASHRYIAERTSALLEKTDVRIISCHLGGSSSLCAIRDGQSMATSMGMSPQSGLPQNNRVGDFDIFGLPAILTETGQTLDQVLETLASGSGLEALSGGAGRDLRDIEQAAQAGSAQAQRAIDVYVGSIRHYLGAYLVELGGVDAIVFTGGIGENSKNIRSKVCQGLDWFGITLDQDRNQSAEGESLISAPESRSQIWTVPTNEEIIVARQAKALLESA